MVVSHAWGGYEIRSGVATAVMHSPHAYVTTSVGLERRFVVVSRVAHPPEAYVTMRNGRAQDPHACGEYVTPTDPPGRSPHAPGEWMQRIGRAWRRRRQRRARCRHDADPRPPRWPDREVHRRNFRAERRRPGAGPGRRGEEEGDECCG